LFERPATGERAILVRIGVGTRATAEDLEEFTALANAAGAVPVASVGGYRARPDPRYFVGSGKAQEVCDVANANAADLVLVDHPLSPSQERNLEELTKKRVLDRSGLILDIFAQRARSFEGKLQVELAQLKHLQTRLVRGWTHLERQKGGIGLRGPGETQLETDRRLIAKRIRTLQGRLEKLARQRETGRQVRKELPVPTVAIVGYTNAGKSTLFNALTGAATFVADQLFATLDPTVRRLQLPRAQTVALADTVGFVRDLPHELVAAFRSTLQEARDAALLLHVIDVSDPQHAERITQVNEVLAAIGAGELPQIEVYNKIDRADLPASVVRRPAGVAGKAWVSAARGTGLRELSELIEAVLFPDIARKRLRIEMSAAGVRSQLFTRKLVRSESVRDDGTWLMDVDLATSQLAELLRRPGVTLEPPAARKPARVKTRAKSAAKKPAKRPSKVRSPCVPGSAFLQSARTRRRATG
jgi:GTP-binding protein HflX